MGTIVFKKTDLEILNKLVFDSSINIEEIKSIVLQDDNTIILNIERRVLEDVKRKKLFFFLEKTYFQGKSSQLKFENVKSFNIAKEKIDPLISNDFLLEIKYNSTFSILELKTVHNNNILSMELNNDIQISLIDLKDSSFGEGSCFGKIGYTNLEWKFFLKELGS